jgi:hypothetical protein
MTRRYFPPGFFNPGGLILSNLYRVEPDIAFQGIVVFPTEFQAFNGYPIELPLGAVP